MPLWMPSGPRLVDPGGGWSLSSKGTSVTAGNKSYGSWTQLASGIGVDAIAFLSVRIWPTANSSFRTYTQIGVGGAGSEKVIANDLYASSGTAGNSFTEYLFPCSIPAGSRIAARCENSATTDSNNVQIMFYGGTHFATGVDSFGFDSVNAAAVDVDPGGTVNTKGSWTQLIASAARDYLGLMIAPGENSTNNTNPSGTPIYIDIGIGGAGSELVIIPNRGFSNVGSNTEHYAPFLPIRIPAGTRVAARCASGSNTVGTRVIGLMAYGVF